VNNRFKKIMKQATGSGRYTGKVPLAKQLYGAASVLSPQNSLKNLELVLALTQAAFLVDCGVGLKERDLQKIANTVPSARMLQALITDAAADSAFEAWDEIVTEGSKLFLLCDKGAKNTQNAHFVKILCWWSNSTKKSKPLIWIPMIPMEQANHVR
jgi:hypothetical protein